MLPFVAWSLPAAEKHSVRGKTSLRLLTRTVQSSVPSLVSITTPSFWPFASYQKPVIAAVNGVAAGAGANIALACDIVVAHEKASFIQAFSKIGLIPDSGGTFTLPRLVGFQRASALMMTGDKVPANQALHMGMVYQVFTEEEYEGQVRSLALKDGTDAYQRVSTHQGRTE